MLFAPTDIGIFEGKPQPQGIYEGEQPLVSDASNDTVSKWATQHGYKMSEETIDYLYNQFFTEKNNETAWQRTLEADNTKYQRAIEDLRKAGINPIQVLGGFGANSPSASAGSVGSGSIASMMANQRTTDTTKSGNQMELFGKLLQIGAIILGALIYTMA